VSLLLNWRVWAAVALAAGLALSHLTVYRSGRHSVQAKWDEQKVIQERASQEQVSKIRELQRAAELRYVVRKETQDRFFVTTVKEVRDAASPLAACPVPPDVVRLLNNAAECARGDSPSACFSASEVPDTR
jgi:hypothetical protein